MSRLQVSCLQIHGLRLVLCALAITGALLTTPAQAQTAAAADAAAATAQPVPVASFFGRIDMAGPQLSPSGRYLAFLRSGANGRNALLMLDLQDATQSRALVGYSDADIFAVQWVGDDHLVYSITDEQVGSAEQDFAPGLFSVARTGAKARQLIKTHRVFITDGIQGVDRRLERNHRLLFVPQDGSGEVIVGSMHPGAGEQTVVAPFRMHVQTLQTRDLEGRLPNDVNRWLFDWKGEPRAAAVFRDGRVQVMWRAAGSTSWQQIMDAPRTQVPWRPYGVDASGGFYVTHPQGPEGTDVLSRWDFGTGQPVRPPMVSVPGFDFRGSLVADRPGGRMLGVRALAENEVTVWSDAAMKALQDSIDQRLPGSINRLSCRNCGDTGQSSGSASDSANNNSGINNSSLNNTPSEKRTVLVESWSDRDPGTFYLWQGATQKLSRLGRMRPAINPDEMADLNFHRIQARDGRPLPVWLTLPRRAPGAAPPPVVVLVHGGPMVRGGDWSWHALPQFLASRGYAVVEPEFRGSDGYGAAHLRAGWKQWGRAMQDDIADALLWATAQGHVDGKRACIAGASYGGYATLMGLVRHPELYRCGFAAMAVTDLMRLVQGSWWWRDDIADEGRRYDLPLMVGDANIDADMLRQNSPVLQAVRIRAPVMLVHGAQDQRVPIVHARDMRKALQDAGNEPEWLVFSEEGHGWRKPENQFVYAQRLEAFLARHLRPENPEGPSGRLK